MNFCTSTSNLLNAKGMPCFTVWIWDTTVLGDTITASRYLFLKGGPCSDWYLERQAWIASTQQYCCFWLHCCRYRCIAPCWMLCISCVPSCHQLQWSCARRHGWLVLLLPVLFLCQQRLVGRMLAGSNRQSLTLEQRPRFTSSTTEEYISPFIWTHVTCQWIWEMYIRVCYLCDFLLACIFA